MTTARVDDSQRRQSQTGSDRTQASGGLREPPTASCASPRAFASAWRYYKAQGQEPRIVARHPDLRSHLSLGLMDLPGPSACVGRDPLSHKAKGVLTGAWVTNEHRSVRAQSRRPGGLGVAFGRSRLLLRVPWQLRARSTRRGRAWLRGVPGVQETARSAVSCSGLRGASSHIAPSFHGFRCFGAKSSSEQLQI